jgi:tetratricopeptide (TPR) repeat protein
MTMFRQAEARRYTGSTETSAESVDCLAREAAAHASRSDYRAALSLYGRALLLDDSDAVLWFNYANVQRQLGQKSDAVESFEFALRLDSRLYAARYSLANVLFELGEPLAAMAHYEEVVAQNPDYMPAWRNLGRLYFAIGHLERAEELLCEGVRRAPDDREMALLLQDVLLERQQSEEN